MSHKCGPFHEGNLLSVRRLGRLVSRYARFCRNLFCTKKILTAGLCIPIRIWRAGSARGEFEAGHLHFNWDFLQSVASVLHSTNFEEK